MGAFILSENVFSPRRLRERLESRRTEDAQRADRDAYVEDELEEIKAQVQALIDIFHGGTDDARHDQPD